MRSQLATPARGIVNTLLQEAGTTASEQAIKTATEETFRMGMPLPTEQYSLSHSFQYFNEQAWGFYGRIRFPHGDLADWIEETKRVDHCRTLG